MWSFKNGRLSCQNTKTLYRLPKEPLSQNKLFTNLFWHPQWNCHISRTQCPISKLFASKASWKNSHFGNNKVNFDLLRQLVLFFCLCLNRIYQFLTNLKDHGKSSPSAVDPKPACVATKMACTNINLPTFLQAFSIMHGYTLVNNSSSGKLIYNRLCFPNNINIFMM